MLGPLKKSSNLLIIYTNKILSSTHTKDMTTEYSNTVTDLSKSRYVPTSHSDQALPSECKQEKRCNLQISDGQCNTQLPDIVYTFCRFDK